MRERISCRLNLNEAGLQRELELEYLPEECRSFTEIEKRQSCIQLYKGFLPCWKQDSLRQRIDCAASVVGLSGTVSEEVSQCGGQLSCVEKVRGKVYSMIKFRLYDLSERAEELMEHGADVEAVTDLVNAMETLKQKLNTARTKQERKKIILDAREAWRMFVMRIKDQL